MTLVLLDGNVKELQYASDDDKVEDKLNACFGDMLKALMGDLSEDGTLGKLPLRKDAFMVIEEFDGSYFWPEPRSCKTKGRISRTSGSSRVGVGGFSHGKSIAPTD